MLSHKAMKAKMLSDPAVKAEYDRLEVEFKLLDALIAARKRCGLSQSQVAQRMGTQTPAISRIESTSNQHSPSIRTLQKYARAVGCSLEVTLRPARRRAS